MQFRQMTLRWRSATFLVVACIFAFWFSPHALALPLTHGFEDFGYPSGTGGNSHPSGEKPESKLWFNHGFWWGVLWSNSGNAYHIFWLDPSTQTWMDTGSAVDDRNDSKVDVLWDTVNQKLYVVSHIFSNASGSFTPVGQRGELYRYTYNSTNQTYALDNGFPVEVNDATSEALVIAKDSTDRLWVTYAKDQQIYVNHSGTSDTDWDSENGPFVLPVGNVNVNNDDLSSVIAFNGKIGVMWSNQSSDKIYFAVHADTSLPHQGWSNSIVAFDGAGNKSADDHIKLQALPNSDPAGFVFAAIKTSEAPPRIMLLVCANSSCTNWTSHTVWAGNSNFDNPTRPTLLVDQSNRKLYVFANIDPANSPDLIAYKDSDLDNPQFTGIEAGNPFIEGSSASPNDVTSTKQNVDSLSGLAALATGSSRYYHNQIAIAQGSPAPDIAVIPGAYNYGNVIVGTFAEFSFDVFNSGSALLDVTATDLGGVDADAFTIESGGGAFMLDPDAIRNVVVEFRPVTTGPYNASLTVSSNDPDENPTQVALSGTGVESLPPEVVFEGTETGGVTSASSVTTSSPVVAVSGNLYLAAIASRPLRSVTSITGLGLVWTQVTARCGGRGQTGIEVWSGQGIPSGTQAVTATFDSSVNSGVIGVSRYSGVDPTSPFGTVVSGNTNGINGACSGGTDSAAYTFNLTTTMPGSVVYGAASMRNKSHEPGVGYTEQLEIAAGSGGSTSAVATEDQIVPSASTVQVDGLFSSTVDWAVIGLEIRAESSSNLPNITSFTPTSGPVGTVVTLSGSGFNGATDVAFNGTPASSFTVTSATQLSATVAAGTTTGTISVTSPSGVGTSAAAFTVTAATTITSFTPTSGPVGTVVTLSGSGFNGATDVAFNGTPASSFTVTSATQLSATVADGTTTGTISVTSPSGVGTSAAAFTVTAATTITSFTPTSGPVGTVVTLSGSGFNGATDVAFNGTAASSFTVTSATQLSATVAAETTTGTLSVTSPSGVGTSAEAFNVTIPGASVNFEGVQTGGSTGTSSVTTSSPVVAVSGNFYLAAIASRPLRSVTSITGLGLVWTQVTARCGGRGQTGIEVWSGQGTPSETQAVTATFDRSVNSGVIGVSRYSGVDPTSPFGTVVSGNTNGINGACSGGTDSAAYTLNLTTTMPGSVVYGAASMRNKSHEPGVGYTERLEIAAGSSGNTSGVGTEDQTVPSASTVQVDGLFSSIVDWAVIGLELKREN